MADQKTDAQKAEEQAAKERAKAAEARAAADAQDKTVAEKKAEAAEAKADDARAKAAEARASEDVPEPMTAGEAKVAGPIDPDLSAGDHFAQKFGNDPANPKPTEAAVNAEANVRLTRITPDVPGGPVVTDVPEIMVGDYLRAGWSRG